MTIVARQKAEAAGERVRRGGLRADARRVRGAGRGASRPPCSPPGACGTTGSSTRATRRTVLGIALSACHSETVAGHRRASASSGCERHDDPAARAASPGCSSPTAARSPCRIFRTAHGLGHRHGRGVLRRRTPARRTCARPTSRCPSRGSIGRRDLPRRRAGRRGRAAPRAPTPSTRATASCPRTRTSPRAVLDAGLTWVGPAPGDDRGDGLQGRGQARGRRSRGAAAASAPSSRATTSTPGPQRPRGVGFPLLVKASAGGGGRGMRLVADAGRAGRRGRAARREAASAFGDDTVFAERYLARRPPRRGAGLRRRARHGRPPRRARVLDPAPAPEGRRGGAVAGDHRRRRGARMCAAAVALARAIGYVGAGTVEFLVVGEGADQEFFFLEMNTRLQVEHPVTEAVTGLDLVAAAARASPRVDRLRLHPGRRPHRRPRDRGAASTPRTRPPATSRRPGRCARWDEAPGVRWDCRRRGRATCVSPYYDPLLAKVIAHAAGPRAASAVGCLARALRASAVHGVAHEPRQPRRRPRVRDVRRGRHHDRLPRRATPSWLAPDGAGRGADPHVVAAALHAWADADADGGAARLRAAGLAQRRATRRRPSATTSVDGAAAVERPCRALRGRRAGIGVARRRRRSAAGGRRRSTDGQPARSTSSSTAGRARSTVAASAAARDATGAAARSGSTGRGCTRRGWSSSRGSRSPRRGRRPAAPTAPRARAP